MMSKAFMLTIASVLVVLLTQCDDPKPVAVYTYTYQSPQGNERALGSLANPQDLSTMEEPSYNEAAMADPFNTFDSDFVMVDAPLGQAYIPTTISYGPGT